jgi:hypothetical protein
LGSEYLGMFHLEKKARDDARKFIAAAAANCPADMPEKPAAEAELARLSQYPAPWMPFGRDQIFRARG